METWVRAQKRRLKPAPSSICDTTTKPDAQPWDSGPFALLVTTARGDLIHGVNGEAAKLGLGSGQRAVDAAAAHDNIAMAYADPAYEAAALERLAAWSRRWTPHAKVDGVDGIALDVTGCLHLFGGDAALLDTISQRMTAMGLTVRLAMAPNHAAAHALARYGIEDKLVIGRDDLEAALQDLPVVALRINDASVTLLRRLGLKTIGQAAKIPRAALKKRFGAKTKRRDPRDDTYDDYLGRATGASDDVLARLDEALGRAPVPFDPLKEEEPLRILEGLVEPVLEIQAVLACLRPMIDRLMAMLKKREEGVLSLALEAFRVDGGRSSTTLRLSRATRETDHIMRLLLDRLDGWQSDFGFDALAVEAVEKAALKPTQTDHMQQQSKADVHGLIDRLRTRLGADAVLLPHLYNSHIPERAFVWGAQALPKRPTEITVPTIPDRPDRLFENPEEIGVLHALPEGPPARFTWRHTLHDVERVAGPERIGPEWWREKSTVRSRDYYCVETREGRRFWIYREGFSDDERGVAIRWFMHGLFS
ncbi:MAG: DNA polymerase Y family protein [Pseudomonadota bacterium]